MNEKRKIIFTIILLLLVYISIESLCFISLALLKKTKDKFYDPVISSLSEEQVKIIKSHLDNNSNSFGVHHPILGWSIRKNGVSKEKLYSANSQGIRSDKEYQFVPPKNVIRISAFGESFTFGDEVSNENTWEEQMSNMAPNLEILNFGVSAYGLDQAYLRYLEDGKLYNSHIVIIGFMSENIYRNVNVFRPFYWSVYENSIFTKPRFSINNNNLILLENPLSSLKDYELLLTDSKTVLSRIGLNDYYYQIRYKAGPLDFLPSIKFIKMLNYYYQKKLTDSAIERNGFYNTESEAFLVTAKLFDQFYQAALDNNSLPIIVVFPDINDQYRYRREKTKRYEPLITYFKKRGYIYIDILEVFDRYEKDTRVRDIVVGRWGHYSALGNRIAAEYIADYLKSNELTTIANIKKAVRERKQQGEQRP